MGVHRYENLILLKIFSIVLSMGVTGKNNVKKIVHIFINIELTKKTALTGLRIHKADNLFEVHTSAPQRIFTAYGALIIERYDFSEICVLAPSFQKINPPIFELQKSTIYHFKSLEKWYSMKIFSKTSNETLPSKKPKNMVCH